MPYRFFDRGGYIELQLFGVIEALERLAPEEWEAIRRTKAVLYNYEELAGYPPDPWQMADGVRDMVTRGIRLAGYAPQPAWFGLNRQLIQIAGAPEDMAQAFRDRVAAVAWLLLGDTRPE